VRARARAFPRAGWLCALVALATALAWGFVTPPAQVPDENAHFAYVQYLAETGKLPRERAGSDISPEESRILGALRFYSVAGRPDNKPPWTRAGDRVLRSAEADPGSRVGTGSAITASNNPPLYYLVQAVPYWVSPSHDLLDRLAFMRIVSALMAAATVLLVFAFLRELLPGEPWAWTVGALVVAFQPLFGSFGGGVNNDDLLYLASAALFYTLARAFRRGLDRSTGAALGVATAVGLLAKTNFAGFLPAVLLALGLLVWRARRAGGDTGRVRRGMGAFALTAIVPVALYLIALQTVWVRPVNTAVGGLGTTPGGKTYNIPEQLSYAWQLYLPRLPFMQPQFGDGLPLDDLWFKGLVGRFGWLDYGFPEWVYDVAWGFAAVVAALGVAGLLRFRRAVLGRWAEAAVYLVAAAGLLAVIAFAGYRARVDTGEPFEQARYLLPLLPLYAALVAIGVRALGRRWGPAAGALLVCAAAGHTLFSLLLTLGRFYA
jgi:4-amino-4-deoxy-L-arabinose transferase-like glycosyltransferase